MLKLASKTPPEWAHQMVPRIDEILVDHAHCEKKAASTAVNLIFRYTRHDCLMRPLSELAREELTHFEQVLDLLDARGVPFVRLRPSPYAGRLMTIVREKEPHKLLDTLLCCALIEARSCERMKLLSEHLTEPVLAEFYKSLLASEARHHRLYVDLAEQLFPRDQVTARLDEIAAHEASILVDTPPTARLHN